MKKMFIGFLLMFLNINITMGYFSIDLLPDFVGFILLAVGMKELEHEAPRYLKVRPFVIGMSVFSGIIFLLNLFGLGISFTMGVLPGHLIQLVGFGITCFITYSVVRGIQDIEYGRSVFLNGEYLKKCWMAAMIAQGAFFVLASAGSVYLTFICLIAALVCNIMFLVGFNKTRRLYEALPCAGQPSEPQDSCNIG